MYDAIPEDDMDFEDIEWQRWLQGLVNSKGIVHSIFLLFFSEEQILKSEAEKPSCFENWVIRNFPSLNYLDYFYLEDFSIEEDHEDTEYNFMAEANQKEEKEEYRNDRAVRITRKLHKSSKTTLKEFL